MDYLITIVQHILHSHKIEGDRMEICKILHSDPAYPSAISMIRALSFWGIYTSAYKTDFEHLTRETKEKVVHCNVNGGRFFFIKKITSCDITLYDGTTHLLTTQEFLKIWQGIVLVIESSSPIAQKRISKPHRNPLSFAIIYYIVAMLAFRHNAVLLTIGGIGFVLSYFLLLKTTLKYVDLPFCSHGKLIDCESVSNSNPFVRNAKLNLPVMGCFYFLFILLSSSHEGVSFLNVFISTSGALVVFYLMFFQFFMLKKICIYCLGISILVISIFVIMSTAIPFSTISLRITLNDILATIVSGAISFLLLSSLRYKQKSASKEIALLKLKRTPGMFEQFLKNGREFYLANENALIYGADKGIYTIDTIIDLDCKHCRSLVQEMQNIMRRYHQLITWRLYIDGEGKKLRKDKLQPLQIIEEYRINKQWSLDCISKGKHNRISEATDETMRKYMGMLDDIRKNHIEHYPTVIFNGVEFPKLYNISDINILISDWAQGGNPPNK